MGYNYKENFTLTALTDDLIERIGQQAVKQFLGTHEQESNELELMFDVSAKSIEVQGEHKTEVYSWEDLGFIV